MPRLNGSPKLGLALGTFAIALGITMAAWQNPLAPPAAGLVFVCARWRAQKWGREDSNL